MDSRQIRRLEQTFNNSPSDEDDLYYKTDKELLLQTLKELTELVETDELIGLVAVGYCANDNLIFVEDGSLEPYSVIGALDCFKTELVHNYHVFSVDKYL
jgi:hypothetical protein